MSFCSKCNEPQENFYKGRKCEKCFKYDRKIENKKYQQAHKNIVSATVKRYKDKNKTIINDKNRIYRESNKEKIIKYRKNTRERVNCWTRGKRKSEPSFRLREIISGAVRVSLKNNNGSKNKSSILKFLPYSIKELKAHLEKQFESWMSWSNWGRYNPNTWNDNNSTTWTWNIDHIVPHSKLKYSSMEDENFQKCWSLNNLRPLSSKTNVIDGSRR